MKKSIVRLSREFLDENKNNKNYIKELYDGNKGIFFDMHISVIIDIYNMKLKNINDVSYMLLDMFDGIAFKDINDIMILTTERFIDNSSNQYIEIEFREME